MSEQTSVADTIASNHYATVDGTVWPVNVGDLEWKLRYVPHGLTRGEELVLASVVSIYSDLIHPDVTQKDAIAALKRGRTAGRAESEVTTTQQQ